ncbi:MAG TPA: FAD-dependent oxidoreductase [Caulobacteraceae bacterium]|nr:FAD-dependent oxidoreductase [Caulobacteraceae bacterium]
MTERVLILGAGIAGLFTALALAPGEHEVVLVERDPPPPDGGADAVFFDWKRRGVGQLRHSHGFLARMREVIRARHPALLDQLRDAGCREIGLTEMMPAGLRGAYQPEPGDEAMVILTSRRTTFELLLRRYVEGLPGVSVISDAFVRALMIGPGDGALRVVGASVEQDGKAADWPAAIVVDAQGRLSACAEQLRAAGGHISEAAEDCGILYFTRHYRRTAEDPPPARATATGDLSYIKYGRFPGDNGCFSITLAVPEAETELRTAVVRPEVFDHICALLPGIAAWVDRGGSEPISPVYGMGDLRNHWRRFVSDDQRAILGFFAVGDSLARTNPLYGRGCSFAAVQSEILGQVVRETDDAAVRARLYDARVTEALRPFYDDMCGMDRDAIRRAQATREGDGPASLAERVGRSFRDDGVAIAVRSDLPLLRAALREFNMLDPPRAWVRQPATLAKSLRRWARGRAANARFYPPPLGPGRAEMLAALGLA